MGNPASRWRLFARGLIGVALVLAAAYGLILYRTHFHSPGEAAKWAIESFRALGAWAPVAFVACYCLAAQLFMPVSVFTLAAGPLFGIGWGIFWVFVSINLSGAAGFGIGRFLLRDWVEEKIAPRVPGLYAGIGKLGWKFAAIIRFLPIFPFTPVNFAMGAAPISFKTNQLTLGLCTIPVISAYVWLGWSMERAALAPEKGKYVVAAAVAVCVLVALIIAAKVVLPKLATRPGGAGDASR